MNNQTRRNRVRECRAEFERRALIRDEAAVDAGFKIAGMQENEVEAKPDWVELVRKIRSWGAELGFQQVGVADCELAATETRLRAWLDRGWHGDMDYMARHGTRRTRPAELIPGTVRIISARMNYLPDPARDSAEVLNAPERAFLSRYALGRDYHKVMRSRLQQLADRISAEVGPFHYRAFTDSAPVMEVALAEKAGLGWRGKHTLLLNRDAGSYFFLGEIYTDLPLPADPPAQEHCGTCRKCLDVCPTGAIVAPYELDARRCISYLTIEHKGSIPEQLRPLIGNRVYGCDDCQLECPWNRFARLTEQRDFAVRNGLDDSRLVDLFRWSEAQFHERLAGSAILRIGYERWLRNLAVGMGNALQRLPPGAESDSIRQALESRRDDASPLVREHVAWALAQCTPHERTEAM
jgi:epoxyqueuosine reductase